MKTIKKLLTLGLIFIALNSSAQIKILSTGAINVGNPASVYGVFNIDYTGYYSTNLVLYPTVNNSAMLGKSGKGFIYVYTYNTANPSDVRLKENIKGIKNALSIVKSLNGVEFDYKAETFDGYNLKSSSKEKELLDKRRKNYLGFLAQDVQKVLPQVVFHDDSTDLYSMDYTKLIPVLVEAIKEQQAKIDELSAKIEDKNTRLKSTEIKSLENANGASLEQNAPNPFSQNTQIGYYLPETIKSASLVIYNMNGLQLKSILIMNRGRGTETINGSEFQPGIYLYALIADGREIDTKHMILTQK